MGNRISWDKGKQTFAAVLNERDYAGGTFPEVSQPDPVLTVPQISKKNARMKCPISARSDELTCSRKVTVLEHQVSRSCETCPKNQKSDDMTTFSSANSLDDGSLKSNSETCEQFFTRSKLSTKVCTCTSSKGQQKTDTNGPKCNHPQARMRLSAQNKSRQLSGSNNHTADYRGVHPISPQGREIIQACFSNRHREIGYRICMRVFERHPDYQRFVYALGRERWLSVSTELREYLNNVVSKVHDIAAVEEISRHYGERHVPLKKYGFKPYFWVSIADAMTIECVILDMANHQLTETVMAWSQLTSLMFTSIRDGYYAALRSQRKTLKNCKSSEWQLSVVDSIQSTNTSAISMV